MNRRHVSMRGFGLEQNQSEEPSHLEQLLSRVAPMGAIRASILRMEAYDNWYKLHDHTAEPAEPFALQKMHPGERLVRGGALHKRMLEFAKARVATLYGLNLQEFLSQPKWMNDLILEDCEKRKKTLEGGL